jgi:acetyltransferase-like isoleucine patch superfamily enzyme
VLRGRARIAVALQRPRVLKYGLLSNCGRVSGKAVRHQPVLLLGAGTILIGREVEFGWPTSKSFHSGYCHVEATNPGAVIEIGDGAQISNNAFIKSEGPGIRIGPGGLLGSEVTIYDSDFHELAADRRRGGRPQMAEVELEEDVFVGDRVLILKGVRVGRGSVIGAGSVVCGPIPEGVVAAGNPARVLRELSESTPARSLGPAAVEGAAA